MFSFDFGRDQRFSPVIETENLILRAGEPRDAEAWIALREASKAHLTRWEPAWRSDDITPDIFRVRLRAQERERRAGSALPLFIFEKSEAEKEGAFVGGVTLSSIRYHASCSAEIGYWVGEPFLRQGVGSAAVGAVCEHAFQKLALNRLQAACQPGNSASRRVLEKTGFRKEGLARDYLFINGDWRDHCLYALTASDYFGACGGRQFEMGDRSGPSG